MGVPSAIVSPRLRTRFATRLPEDVAHGGRAALDGEEVELSRRAAGRRTSTCRGTAARPPRRARACGRARGSCRPRSRRRARERSGPRRSPACRRRSRARGEELRARAVRWRRGAPRTVGDAVGPRHPPEVGLVPHALRLLQRERPDEKNASRGVVATQFGFPRPASRNWWVADFACAKSLA